MTPLLNMTRYLALAGTLLISLGSATAYAETAVHLEKATIDMSDKPSLQRGAMLFANYCQGCHSIEFSRYNRVARDIGLSPKLVQENLIFTGSFSTRQNEYKPTGAGDNMITTMLRSDAKAWFGAPPPDLSTIVRARGADYIHTYLKTFYVDPSRPFGMNNLAFPLVGMPHVLLELQGLQAPIIEKVKNATGEEIDTVVGVKPLTQGTLNATEYNRVAADLTNYLAYIAEPAQIERAIYGPWVLLFILLMTAVFYALNKEYWRDIK